MSDKLTEQWITRKGIERAIGKKYCSFLESGPGFSFQCWYLAEPGSKYCEEHRKKNKRLNIELIKDE